MGRNRLPTFPSRASGSLLFSFCVVLFLIGGCSELGDPPFTLNFSELDKYAPASSTDIAEGSGQSFEKYFELVDTIVLSDEVVIGTASRLEVGPNGELLVLDPTSDNVILFDKKGQFLSVLDVEPCHPGFDWNPGKLSFRDDGRILVVNGGFGGFYFDGEGHCLESLNGEYFGPRFVAVGPDHNLYGFRMRRVQYGIEWASEYGNDSRYLIEGNETNNILVRVVAGGILVDESKHVFLTVPNRPFVYKISPEDEAIQVLGYRPSYYRQMSGETPVDRGASGRSAMDEVNRIVMSSSVTINMHLLDRDKIMILYTNSYNRETRPSEMFGIHVMNTNGESLIEEEILVAGPVFSAGRGGLAYLILHPELEDDASVQNPTIEVYEFQN